MQARGVRATKSVTGFEELCDNRFESTVVPVQEMLQEAHVAKKDIHEVVLVGGASGMPLGAPAAFPSVWRAEAIPRHQSRRQPYLSGAHGTRCHVRTASDDDGGVGTLTSHCVDLLRENSQQA